MANTTQISFIVQNQNYGIEITDVRAVERADGISPVLGAPEFIKGVLNLRGELIPVYSIRKKFGLPDKPVDEDTKLIIVNLSELSVAIEVDMVGNIVNVEENENKNRPAMLASANTDFVGHVAEVDGKIFLLIDLPHLIPDAERSAMIDMLETGKEKN